MSRPLVYLERGVEREARQLFPQGTVVECEIEEAIAACAERKGALQGVIELPGGLRARYERRPGRTRPRPWAWVIVDVFRGKEEAWPC